MGDKGYIYMLTKTMFVTDDSYWHIVGFYRERDEAEIARRREQKKPEKIGHADYDIAEINLDTLDFNRI